MKIIIEAAHVYTNKPIGVEEELGAKFGSLLSTYLGQSSHIEKWLFVDDYNPKFSEKHEIFNEEDYVKIIGSFGFHPDKIFNESNLVERAKHVLDLLLGKGYAYTGDGFVFLDNKKLYDISKDKYMCTLLDACFYLEKMEQSNSCVTVLDKKYRKQQKDTMNILKILGKDIGCVKQFFYSAELNNIILPHNGKTMELPIYEI